ncbi:sigma 54-interacting transcriptional regulator [Sporomusa sphaeroides]|uniref:Limonene hydroxylase n=1 Tax=Sporomusa sphaeroides DSM 2875 TaxID=1337886 RepID=A0ABP2C840_9FIRM|nr:sigma 54-interacting transcriptional regulator [Sporomusa sphaeroides]OLS54809.1 limonene hydroxylase [Sporomusa sphaeroides DSM 2875]CVK20042.1 Limonene hydroxylase [Sporomusa sphaeroides DSM 2875]
MAKIAFIAPDKQLFLQGRKIIHELGIADRVVIYLARLKRAIRLAKALEQQDVSVIISRGGTARVIIKARIQIPVVEIPISGQDLAQVFYEAKKITALDRPQVAMVAFDNMVYDIESLSAILGINLTIYRLETSEDIPARIAEVAQSDADIVVGGIKTVLLAAKQGLTHHLIRSGEFSIRTAFAEAEKIIQARKIEKEQAQKFKALADYSLEGIISINPQKTVEVFNPAAETLLKISAPEIVGKQIDQVLSGIEVDLCLAKRKRITGQTVQQGSIWLTYNIAPVIVDSQLTGAIITFQDITHIQELEAKIRNQVLARRFVASYRFTDIIGSSPQLKESKRIAREMALVDNATVLIFGESGTGKELFAQSIHNESCRKHGPFVAVNCAALPANLLESELFGYVEGAFTGAAKKGKPGLFEMAHRGTIFLDEISEMDKYGQSRLLRVLQERQVMRLGDDKYIPIDVRIIAATNKKLGDLVKEGQFRQDLFYRFKVLTLNLAPLRKRSADIACLAQYFVRQFTAKYNKQVEIVPAVYRYLQEYDWPGNVRELMYFLERLIIICNEQVITVDVVKQYWDDREDIGPDAAVTVRRPEVAEIVAALEKCNSNISRTAELLGMDRSTLYRKLKSYNIETKKTY